MKLSRKRSNFEKTKPGGTSRDSNTIFTPANFETLMRLFIILVGLTLMILWKKCSFSIYADAVWCPIWLKNLGLYLGWMSGVVSEGSSRVGRWTEVFGFFCEKKMQSFTWFETDAQENKNSRQNRSRKVFMKLLTRSKVLRS